MKKWLILLYGILSYGIFLVVFLALVDFLGNFILPKTIDNGVFASIGEALLVTLGLIILFGVLHSGMARQSFKQWWTRLIPGLKKFQTSILAISFSELKQNILRYHPAVLVSHVFTTENGSEKKSQRQ